MITYSLYGANPKYVNGAVKNAQMVGSVFPGWTARYYTDVDSVPPAIQAALREAGAEIVPIDMAKCGSCVERAVDPGRRRRPVRPPGGSEGSGRAYAPRSAA